MNPLSTVRSWVEMPGSSHRGPLPVLGPNERALVDEMFADVSYLAERIGVRNYQSYDNLIAAMEYIEQRMRQMGYQPQKEIFTARGRSFTNLVADVPNAAAEGEITIIGAHYDSARGCPAANDNASGVAALLALAKRFADCRPERRLRFVAFTNEEPPFSFGPTMGSFVNARNSSQRREHVTAMISLETLGYYSDAARSQRYPPPLGRIYPTVGNFIGFVSNLASKSLLYRAIEVFRKHTAFPSEGAALPAWVPGVGWSDHWSFWKYGYPAIMVTDTAPFRYPHYHRPTDTIDKLDFDKLARVVHGLGYVCADLAGVSGTSG